ncbi:EamA domain-containing membrane protein RarD [Planktotalea frisia]|uniref:Riboflavin transporter n=1 Tax=Planktotalea frisia TaxID=696762 RepID=A0A1L9NRZ3_9RHOB|nr:DMT family transporter [Planktotalea frisia]OJI92086.1 riboflavin transporter [Planktotalea frisia]PZX33033.1 EamA domain-containing membrane protein RarD [Planktotalea frisia]
MEEHKQRPLLGVIWMVVAGLCFVAVTALVKLNGPRIPAGEAAFLRYGLGLLFLLPLFKILRATTFTPRLWRLIAVRGFFHTFGVTLWFFAMTQISIAEVTAMNYLTPVFVTIAAAIFLKERLAFRRILAVCFALLGAMIILRPGFREVSIGHLAMLAVACMFCVSYLTAKMLADALPASVVVSMLSIAVTVGLAPLAYAVWIPPTAGEVGLLFLVACFATAGHYAMTLAFANAPLTVTQPVTFIQLIWAVSLGYFAFGEGIDLWVIFGGFVILSSITFITWREAVLKRGEITPGTNVPKV